MGDYDLEILEQYPIQVDNVRKVRGAFLCETDRGLMLLKQAALSKPRMLVMNEIHKAMKKQEHLRCDELIPNREGEFLTATEDGTTYYLKAWYPGRECDVRKHGEILEAARLLAKIHRLMELPGAREGFRSSDLLDEYRRHNREMKKVWSFIRKKPIKGEFESRFLECFEDMYRVAAAVEERLGNSSYRRLQKEAKERGSFIHGEYNYHNILITPEGMTAVNFEHVGRDLQAADLAYFLRKVMEKHQWNESWEQKSSERTAPSIRCQKRKRSTLHSAFPIRKSSGSAPIHITTPTKHGFHRKVLKNCGFLLNKMRSGNAF